MDKVWKCLIVKIGIAIYVFTFCIWRGILNIFTTSCRFARVKGSFNTDEWLQVAGGNIQHRFCYFLFIFTFLFSFEATSFCNVFTDTAF